MVEKLYSCISWRYSWKERDGIHGGEFWREVMEFSLLHFLDEEKWMELEGRETHAICTCGYIET